MLSADLGSAEKAMVHSTPLLVGIPPLIAQSLGWADPRGRRRPPHDLNHDSLPLSEEWRALCQVATLGVLLQGSLCSLMC